MLTGSGYEVLEEPVWGAIPSLTATGKPAVSPVRESFVGELQSKDFKPIERDSGTEYSSQVLIRLLDDAGFTYLAADESGNGRGKAWCENGKIDHEGHDGDPFEFASRLNGLLWEIAERVKMFFINGWKRVILVTDHGFLSMPGGFPKMEISNVLLDERGGRAASPKENANVSCGQYPWHWNSGKYYALADGVNCFKEGVRFAHGGLSLQECLTLRLTVSGKEVPGEVSNISVKWVSEGICKVTVSGDAKGKSLDLRIRAEDSTSSVANKIKPFESETKDGETLWIAKIIFAKEKFNGKEAFAVILDGAGRLVTYAPTILGGS
jgi:hypothetical protein